MRIENLMKGLTHVHVSSFDFVVCSGHVSISVAQLPRQTPEIVYKKSSPKLWPVDES